MRKYLIGILIGVALTVSSSVFADDVISLIGQKIQGEFPVKINGETLEKPAIIINGTSYLPNRAIADALGMNIKFDADLGIELTNKEETTVMQETPTSLDTAPTPSDNEKVYSSAEIDLKIRTINTMIWMTQAQINESTDADKIAELEADKKKNEAELAIWEARKAALQ